MLGMSTAELHGLSGFGAAGWIWLAGLLQTLRARALEARILAWMAVGLYLFVELFPVDVRVAEQRLPIRTDLPELAVRPPDNRAHGFPWAAAR